MHAAARAGEPFDARRSSTARCPGWTASSSRGRSRWRRRCAARAWSCSPRRPTAAPTRARPASQHYLHQAGPPRAAAGGRRRGDGHAGRGDARAPRAPAARRPSPGDTILVVEDNAVNQRVIEAMLAKRGFAVECADNGREALDAAPRVRTYALVFMDCQMPEMDGYEATAAIRERESGDGDAPADRRDDRERDEGRPRALPGRGHGRLPRQAAAPGGARRRARALARHAPAAPAPARSRAGAGVDGARRRGAHARVPRRLPRDRRPADRAVRGEHAAAAARAARGRRGRRRESVRRAAHKLKGSCQNIGASVMAALVAELERAATAAPEQLEDLEVASSRTPATPCAPRSAGGDADAHARRLPWSRQCSLAVLLARLRSARARPSGCYRTIVRSLPGGRRSLLIDRDRRVRLVEGAEHGARRSRCSPTVRRRRSTPRCAANGARAGSGRTASRSTARPVRGARRTASPTRCCVVRDISARLDAPRALEQQRSFLSVAARPARRPRVRRATPTGTC